MHRFIVVAVVIILALLVGCGGSPQSPTPTPSPSPKPTLTPTPTPTPRPSPTPTPSPTATATPVATVPPTPTATPSPSPSPVTKPAHTPVYLTDPNLKLEFAFVTDSAKAGDTVKVEMQTLRKEERRADISCKVMVYLPGGKSSTLPSKTADADGKVSWTWQVPADVTAGEGKVEVFATLGPHQSIATTFITYTK